VVARAIQTVGQDVGRHGLRRAGGDRVSAAGPLDLGEAQQAEQRVASLTGWRLHLVFALVVDFEGVDAFKSQLDEAAAVVLVEAALDVLQQVRLVRLEPDRIAVRLRAGLLVLTLVDQAGLSLYEPIGHDTWTSVGGLETVGNRRQAQ
jgi:hypothetical protein